MEIVKSKKNNSFSCAGIFMSLTNFFRIIYNYRFYGTYVQFFGDSVYANRNQKDMLEGIGKKKWYEKSP